MNVRELYNLLLGVNGDYKIVFQAEENETIKFNMIQLSYETRELIFRMDSHNNIDLYKDMIVSDVLPIIANADDRWRVGFEDINDPSEVYSISCADVSLSQKQIILRYYN